MSTIDSAPEGGKFRAKAASALDGTAGAFGQGDLLAVAINGSGELIAAGASTAEGIILTTEGKRDNTAANYKKVVGGQFYTVFKFAEMVECDQWTSPTVSAGNTLYAAASGDATTTASDEAVILGKIVQGGGSAGMKFVLMVGGSVPQGLLSGGDLSTAVVNGGAAGNITVTGIATTDSLISVVRFGPAAVKTFTKAGAAAGAHTVTGITTSDTLISVTEIDIVGDAVTDRTAEFTISGADAIDNTGGTNTTASWLLIQYADASASVTSDLTSEFSIDSANTIDNTGGTATTGSKLLVVYSS